MSIEMERALQRVCVAEFDEHGSLRLRRLGVGVRATAGQLCLAAERDHEHEPIRISARQLARRVGRDETEAKAIRKSLGEAIRLGMIKRLPPTGELGPHAAWPVLLHPALIAAARGPQPWEGPPIIFPRAWDEADPEQMPGWLVTRGVETAPPVELTSRKGKEKNHYPPGQAAPRSGHHARPLRPEAKSPVAGSRPTPSAAPGACMTSGGRQAARGGSGSRQQPSRGQVCQAQFADRGESLSALQRWLAASRRRMEEPAAPGLEAFCQWMEASAADAGWLAKRAGAWPGAEAGDLAFALQRRSSSTGARGGTFVRGGSAKCRRVSLGELLAGARTQLADAAAVQSGTANSIEAVFWPLGDHALLLVDDVDKDGLAMFEGWNGVAFLETSPGNHQVMLMAPRVLRGDEVQAAQCALARRVGLTLSAVQIRQPRRFPGSVNRKPALGLGGSFTTRLVGEPVAGTLSSEQLAELLAEDTAHQAHQAAKSTGVPAAVAGGGAVRAARGGKARTGPADPTDGQSRARGQASDRSGSGQDWAFGMALLRRVGGYDRNRLVEQIAARAANRQRQGKRASDPDHLRYAQVTVEKMMAALNARKPGA